MIYNQELKNKAYQNAIEKGFTKKWDDAQQFALTISEICESIEADRKGRHAEKYTYPLLPAEKMITTVITESLTKEQLEAGAVAQTTETTSFVPYSEKEIVSRFKLIHEAYAKDTVEGEIADAYIRLLTIIGHKKLSISTTDQFLYRESADIKKLLTKCHCTKAMFVMDILCSCYKISDYGNNNGLEYAIGKALFYLEELFMPKSDLEWHIAEKMKYNSYREPMHGKKY